jgi:hypothetical protein
VAFLLDRARFQVKNAPSIGRLLSRQLLADLLNVIRMQMIVQAGSEPIALCLMQDGSHTVRYVNQTTSVARGHKEESVSRFQNQVLEFLIRQE